MRCVMGGRVMVMIVMVRSLMILDGDGSETCSGGFHFCTHQILYIYIMYFLLSIR